MALQSFWRLLKRFKVGENRRKVQLFRLFWSRQSRLRAGQIGWGHKSSYDKALEIDPEYFKVWYEKGNVLSKLGKYDEANQAHDKAANIEIGPEDMKGWYNKGRALEAAEPKTEAQAAYAKGKS